MKKEISLVLAIAIMIVIGGGAFYGGLSYQKAQSAKQRSGFAGRAGQFGDQAPGNRIGAARGGTQPVSGEILSINDKSITVKMRDGSSKIVLIGDSTLINKSTQGNKVDLANNQNVMVVGTTNSDGSVTATNINIQPIPALPVPAQ